MGRTEMEFLDTELVLTLSKSIIGIGLIVYSMTLIYLSRKGCDGGSGDVGAGCGEVDPGFMQQLGQKISNLEGWMRSIDKRMLRLEDLFMKRKD
jgi:hypothetical protein